MGLCRRLRVGRPQSICATRQSSPRQHSSNALHILTTHAASLPMKHVHIRRSSLYSRSKGYPSNNLPPFPPGASCNATVGSCCPTEVTFLEVAFRKLEPVQAARNRNEEP